MLLADHVKSGTHWKHHLHCWSDHFGYSSRQPKPATFIVAEWLVEIVRFFVESSSALKKELIAHFSVFFSQLFRGWPNF
jgi:hypothetical protein